LNHLINRSENKSTEISLVVENENDKAKKNFILNIISIEGISPVYFILIFIDISNCF